MPSVNSSSVASVLDSSTVITPSLPTLVERFADERADPRILAGNRCYVGDFLLTARPVWHISSSAAVTASTAVVDAALERYRVGACRDVAQADVDHGLSEHGGGGRAVTGHVVGLGGHRLGQLGAQVLVRVGQLDLAGDRHAVVRDDRRPEGLVEHDVSAAGAEGDLDRIGQLVDSALRARRASSSKLRIFAIEFLSPVRVSCYQVTENARSHVDARVRGVPGWFGAVTSR